MLYTNDAMVHFNVLKNGGLVTDVESLQHCYDVGESSEV